jgi:hypothetical protein
MRLAAVLANDIVTCLSGRKVTAEPLGNSMRPCRGMAVGGRGELLVHELAPKSCTCRFSGRGTWRLCQCCITTGSDLSIGRTESQVHRPLSVYPSPLPVAAASGTSHPSRAWTGSGHNFSNLGYKRSERDVPEVDLIFPSIALLAHNPCPSTRLVCRNTLKQHPQCSIRPRPFSGSWPLGLWRPPPHWSPVLGTYNRESILLILSLGSLADRAVLS